MTSQQQQKPPTTTIITWSDVSLGPLLGRGGFSQIHAASFERRKYKLMFSNVKIVVKSPRPIRKTTRKATMHVRGVKNTTNQQQHDSSSSSSQQHKKKAQKALEDLHTEARLLSKLHHPNVVQLVAVGSTTSSSCKISFLVLERLDKTLVDMIREWKEERQQRQIDIMTQEQEGVVVTNNHDRRRRGGLTAARLLFSSSRRKQQQQSTTTTSRPPLLSRILDAAVMIARGLEYTHSQRIIHRDMKPGNIGFDSNGVVKLLDYGLAREMDTNTSSLAACHLKHGYGTPRYMAPEVGLGTSCGTYSDVYSFTIVLYEMVCLTRPYSNYTSVSDFRKFVYKQHERPSLLEECPDVPLLRDYLLPFGWHWNHNQRPTIQEMRQSLQMKLWNYDTPAKEFHNNGEMDANNNNNTTTVLMLNDDDGEDSVTMSY